MSETFKACTVGATIIAMIIAVVLIPLAVIDTEKSWGYVIGIPIYYLLVSLILFGYLAFSRSQLKTDSSMFILGTLVVTAGGWWIVHAVAFLNVTITEGIYNLLFSRSNA